VIRELNESGESERLGGYIDTLIGKIPGEKSAALCENYAVNAVAAHYCSAAKNRGIDVSARLAVPGEINGALESDLSIIVGNLLENALEACQRMEEGRRFIRMESRLKNGTLAITMDNSCAGKARKKGGIFLSSKREGGGSGLSSVMAVAQKYGGSARFEIKDGVFLSSVYVQIGEADEPFGKEG